MKASLNSKVLVLSISALIIVGSGCDRRGRAPIKGVGAGPTVTSNPTSPSTPLVPTTSPSSKPTVTTTGDKSDSLSKDEAQLAIDARMVGVDGKPCQAPSIDENASASKESFVADLAAINEFKKCMTASGIVLRDENNTQNWTLKASPYVQGQELSPALIEFAKISHEAGSNDDMAYIVMGSRLELSIALLSKLGVKYSEERLRSADVKATDVLQYNQKSITIDVTLAGLANAVKALESGRADILALRTIIDGVDVTKTDAEIKAEAEALQ